MASVSSTTNCPSVTNEDAITLLIQYMHHELSGESYERVVRALKNCPSCQRLYQQLELLFDESAKLEYEASYPGEVERTDRMLNEIVRFYEPTVHTTQPDSQNIGSSLFKISEDCIGCSA